MRYVTVAQIIHHKGRTAAEFTREASKFPDFEKNKFHWENAVREMTVYADREQGKFVLHATAKKVMRIFLGPAPDAPDYQSWWLARLASVEQMKRDGQRVLWAETPPVPLKEDRPAEPAKEEPAKPARKPRAKKDEPPAAEDKPAKKPRKKKKAG